jgi:cytosine/adenosine deaminase-related metal-dependent hydrolase
MKADIVLVDLSHPSMMPVHDPLRSLVFHAADRSVRDVFVDGHQVVAEGRVLTLDQADAAARLQEGQRRMVAAVPGHDYAGRNADQITPPSLPMA